MQLNSMLPTRSFGLACCDLFSYTGAGRLEMTYTPANGGAPVKYEIFNFDGAGQYKTS
jgi:hypothetical protein